MVLMGIIGICNPILLIAGLAWCSVLPTAAGQGPVFNVVDFGARGDGITDDTEAFVRAWTAACGARGSSATLLVPPFKSFLVGPTRFNGPCASARTTVLVIGTITAQPASSWAWAGKNYWLMFYQVDGLTVTGNGGVLDGRGHTWWSNKCKYDTQNCIPEAPTSLVLMSCNNAEVSHLTSKDSPQMHIAVITSRTVSVRQLTITAPGDSPNTDGVHIDRSENVQITGSTIGTGDDCVSIGPGCRFVTVDGIVCGPGHGVSVGSLGKNGAMESVEHVDVKNVHFINTMNGARIKTWPGGRGYAKSISFTNINFTNVDNPVIIDQFYQDRGLPNMAAVVLSNITYTNLQGTSRQKTAVDFDCSGMGSCTEIHVKYVAITASDGRATEARCRNAQGDTYGYVNPRIPCLIIS